MRRALHIVGLASVLALIAPLALVGVGWAQETHISREDGAWGQEITGSLGGRDRTERAVAARLWGR